MSRLEFIKSINVSRKKRISARIGIYESEQLQVANKKTLKENKSLENEYAGLIKTKDKEIRSLDIQVNKNQTALDSSIKTNNELILSIKSKSSKLETCHINLEKTGLKLESIETDLKTTKSEFKVAQKKVTEGERLIARLEGQLAVYEKIKPETIERINCCNRLCSGVSFGRQKKYSKKMLKN